MKAKIKRALSLLTALAIVCSFAVIPASAEELGGLTLELQGGWSGQTLTVDVVATDGTPGKVASYNFSVLYDADVLKCAKIEVTENALAGGNAMPNPDVAGEAILVYARGTDADLTNGMSLGTFTFELKDNTVESQPTDLTLQVTEVANANYDMYDVSTKKLTTDVPGNAPTIGEVTLSETSVVVDGEDVTVTATATSVKGTPMSPDWSITGDAEISSRGVITVPGNAANNTTYTITATDDNDVSKTATLTVTRAPAREELVVEGPSTITVPKEAGKTSSASYKALLTNQFHDDPVETDGVAWSVSSAEGVEIDPATGIVTVTSEAAPKTDITITATKGELTKEFPVRLVDIELTVTPKTDAAYGDTWTEILPVSGMTAKMGDQNLTITSAARTINGQNVDAAKPVPGTYSVDVTVQTAEGEATVTVPVTVGKRAITVELKNQTFTYDGEEHAAGNVTDKGDVAGEDLVFVPVKEVKATDAGVYAVEYTCESELYNATATGGALVIKPQPVEVTDKSPLESIKLFGDTEVECTIDKKTGKVTLDVTVSPDNVKSETRVLDMLEDATGDVKLAIRVDGTKYEYTIKGWALKDDEFKSGKTNTFVATGFVPVKDGVAGNYAPDLGEIEFIVRASRSYGGGGGASTGWDWGDRGNQTINLTPQSIFTDVPDGHTFQKDIVWVYYRGIMKGTTETTFSPASSTNRQQLWMVLGRISGSSPADMAMAREWAVNTGVSDGSKPTGSLTRQQMVTMLYRWAQSKGYVGVTTGSIAGYNDASSVASYAKDAMTWAVGNGIINGSGNNLNPGGTATRGQFAAIMHRFCEKFGV